jgi:hypothetical protein
VAAAPVPPTDLTPQATRLFERVLADVQGHGARKARDKQDWLNLLYHRGGPDNQWVVWDRGSEAWVTRGADPQQGGLPAWIPRCVSNGFARAIDGIAAILSQSQPAQLWAPATDDDADRATAEVCQDAVPVLLDEIRYPRLRLEINKLITLTDRVALVLSYDPDPRHGTAPVSLLTCLACGGVMTPREVEAAPAPACPACGAGPEMITPNGDAIALPTGKLCAELIPSFEFSIPSEARTTEVTQLPWVLLHSRLTVEEALRLWPEAAETIRGAAGRPHGAVSRNYAEALQALSATRTTASGGRSSSARGVDVYRLQHDPIEDDEVQCPQGLYAVRIGDTIVEAGPLPFVDARGRRFKSVLIRSFQRFAGTQWGKPPADDLVPIQTTRNSIESLLLCILLHHASPRTFLPTSITLLDELVAEPGETVRYSSTIPGEKPTVDRGLNPPEGLYRYLELLDQKMEEISRLNSVLVGERPAGDPTLGEIQILQERGMAAFVEALAEQVEFEKALARLLLDIARQTGWAPRFRQVRGENGAWEVKQFTQADLTGRVDVQVDMQSAWPQSPLMTMLRLAKAIELGVLPPPAQDPELQAKILSLLTLDALKPSLDADRKQVARVLEVWKGATDPGQITPVQPAVDNLALHAFFKQLWLKSEEAEEAQRTRPQVYAAMLAHLRHIHLLMAPPPAAGGGVPDGSAVSAAVESGAMRPAPGPARPGAALTAAVQTGALRPAARSGRSLNEMVDAGALRPVPARPPGGAA